MSRVARGAAVARRRPRPRAGRAGPPGRRCSTARRERARAARRRPGRRDAASALVGGARRERGARRPPRPAPDHWRALARRPRRPRTRPTAAALRGRAGSARWRTSAVDRPRRSDALRVAYRRRLLSHRGPRPVRARWRSRTSPASWPTWPPRRSDAALAIARAELPADAEPRPAGGHRAGQVRRPRAQLRQRRRRGLRRRAGRRRRRDDARCATATRLAAALMRVCSAHDRRGHASGRSTPTCAPRARSGALVRTLASHVGVLRAVGADLGVPGAAQGAPGGRRPRARARVRATRWRRWCGRAAERPDFVDDVAGDAPPGRGATSRPRDADRELKLGPGGLRDVEFAVQLLQLVHGRSDVCCAAPPRWSRSSSCPRTGTSAAPTPPSWTARTGSCARWSTASSCTGCAAPTWCPTTRPTCAGSARSMGFRARPGGRAGRRQWRRHAREVRRLHEKLFYRPLLDAVARLDPGEARLTPGGRRGPARGARLRRPGRRAAAPGGADLRGQPAGGDPADAAAGDARLVRRGARPRRRPARLPAGLRRARHDALVPAAAARRRRRRRAAGHGARVQRGTPTDLLLRAPEAVAMLGRRRRAGAARPGRAAGRGAAPRSAGTTTPDAAVGGGARACAAASCSAPRSPTCSGCLDVEEVGDALTDVTAATVAGGLAIADPRGRGGARRTAADPAVASSRWAASAATSSATAATPTCCSCTTRSRAPTSRTRPRRRTPSSASCAGCSPLPGRTRSWSSTPTCGRRAGSGPLVRHARVVRGVLRALVAGVGEPGAAARRAGRRRRASWGSGSSRWSTRCATRRAGWPTPTCARSAGSRPGSRPSGCPRAPTRPCTPSSAAAAWPTSSGRSSCSSCGTAPRCPRCARPARWPRCARRRDAGLLDAGRRTSPGSTPGGWPPGCATRSMLVRGRACRHAARPTPASSPAWRACSATLRAGQGQLVEDYRRATRRARAVVERVFYA